MKNTQTSHFVNVPTGKIKQIVKKTFNKAKNILIPIKAVNVRFGDNSVRPFYTDKQKKGKRNKNSFQGAIGTTLTIACILGFFPVQGLKGNGAHSLRYRLFSFVGILSLITIFTLIWTAILSVVHSAYMLIKATIGKSGGFANATAGGIFYFNNAISAYLLHKIARGWPALMTRWEKVESNISMKTNINLMLQCTAIIVLILATIEHLLSIAINTPDCRLGMTLGNYTIKGCLEEYCLRSHSFIFGSVTYSIPFGLFVFVISKYATFSWNFQDLFLMQICLALNAQFKCLTQMVNSIDPETSCVTEWKRARELYTASANLARDVSILVSSLVLLSFGNNLYFICLQMLNGFTPSLQGPLHNAYFFGSFLFMVNRMIFVTMIAAAIPLEARKALPILYCCPKNAYCTEVERLIKQLVYDEIALTGMGFFTVNRNFILGVAGAIATYEVVLLQFDIGQT